MQSLPLMVSLSNHERMSKGFAPARQPARAVAYEQISHRHSRFRANPNPVA